MTEEAIQRLKKADLLEWIDYVRPEDPSENCVPRKGPGDTTFAKAIRNALLTGASVPPGSSVAVLLYSPGEEVTELTSFLPAHPHQVTVK